MVRVGATKYVLHMEKLSSSIDVDSFFFEAYKDSEKALSNGPNMVYLQDFYDILENIV